MWAMALMTLAALPLVSKLTRPVEESQTCARRAVWVNHPHGNERPQLPVAPDFSPVAKLHSCDAPPGELTLRLPQLWLAVAGIIGLANIFGSLYAGSCVANTAAYVLAAVRLACRASYPLLMAPRTELTFYILPPDWVSPGWPYTNRRHRRQAVRHRYLATYSG